RASIRSSGDGEDLHARADGHVERALRFVEISVDHVPHDAVRAVKSRVRHRGFVRLSVAHRLGAPYARQIGDETHRARVDAEEVEAAFLFAPAIERFEVETDLVDRAARDREVVALFPDRPVVELDPALPLRGDARDDLAADERAADTREERLR